MRRAVLAALLVCVTLSWHDPSTISFNRSLVGMGDAEIHHNESAEADYSGRSSKPIKFRGYPNLPFPEAPFGGAMAFLIGGWISGKGLEKGPFALWVLGWAIGLPGGLIFLLWALPYLATVVASFLF